MDQEVWQQQEAIFHEALKLTGDERSSFLIDACSRNSLDRADIESLLNAFENDQEFLENDLFESGLKVIDDRERTDREGTEVGAYKIGKKLGEGGMGEVYDAFDTELERRVALKFLTNSSLDQRYAKRQLMREAQSAAQLDHPNICTVYGIQKHENDLFIVMQYLEGETLADLTRRTALDREKVLNISRQIIAAVAFAHSHGVIHRDLKPANIMVSGNGQVKVLDFGLAKNIGPMADRLSGRSLSFPSQMGLVMGTVSYMSPEQLRGESLDFQSDIFSIGIILYELVSGSNPFDQKSQAETIAQILYTEPPSLEPSVSGNVSDLSPLVFKCLSKDKAKRFRSADELSAELDTHSANEPKRRKAAFPSAVVYSLVAAIVVIAAALGYWYLYTAAPVRSLAILPIANESGQPEYQYLSDGLTRELIDSFSGLSYIEVRNESFIKRFSGQTIAPEKAGRELNVDAVMAGTLNKNADVLSMSYRLVSTRDGSIIDSEEIPIDESDLTHVRSEIAQRMAEKLRSELSAADQKKLSLESTNNPQALRLYFLGRFHRNRRGPGDLKNAIRYFTEATELAPGYAKAWAGLASSYALYSVPGQSGSITTDEAAKKAKYSAQSALELDPNISEPYTALGQIKARFDWDWAGAEQDYRTALQIDPENADAYGGLSTLYTITGRYDDALAAAQKASDFDPFSITSELSIGTINYFKRDDAATLKTYESVLESHPQNTRAMYVLAFEYAGTGRLQDAKSMAEKVYESNQLLGSAALGYVYGRTGEHGKALEVLRKLDELEKQDYVSPQERAVIYVGMGDLEKAFEYLDAACKARFPAFPGLLSDRILDSMRYDPRFTSLKQCARL